jgi:excisionase family DNA binding protein
MSDGIRWLKVREAADRARCGPKTIYRAVRSGHLRAARIGGRRELRLLDSWIDGWLLGQDNEGPGRHGAAGQGVRAGMDTDATQTRALLTANLGTSAR